MAFDSIPIDSSRQYVAIGTQTFNSNCPPWAASVMVESFPITLKHAIVSISAIAGLTLPGIIDEPGCIAGIDISFRPEYGPDPISLMSFATLISLTDRSFSLELVSSTVVMF